MSNQNNVSVVQLKRAITIREKIDALQAELNEILGGQVTVSKRGRRKMSASARAKIAAAQRARWAKVNGSAVKTKRTMSAKAKAAISAAAKARWKKVKEAGKSRL